MTTEGTATQTETTTEPSGIAGVIGTFGIRGDLFAAQLVNFLIVLVVLWKFAYKPIMKLVQDREAFIEKSVKDAKTIESRLQAIEKERGAIMTATREEAQRVLERAAHDGDDKRQEQVEAAKREVERVITKGKEQLKAEKEAMLVEARKDMASIAVRAAAKIVMHDLTDKRAQSLAEEVVRKMT